MKTNNNSMAMKYFMIAIATLTTVVYLIPYSCQDFYNHFLESFNITDGQAGKLVSFFGLTATPGYFIGGWLADKFNAKKLVVLSAISTAAVGFIVSFSTSFDFLLVLYFIFGITTTCLHWSAFLKVIKSIGDENEQGRLYGFFNGMYGVLGLTITYFVLALISTWMVGAGFRGGIRVYSIISLIAGVLTLLFVKYDESKLVDLGEDKVDFRLIGKALKMPFTWYLGLFTLGYFIIRSTVPYLNPFMTDVFGVSMGTAVFLTSTLRSGVNIIAGPIGGTLIDKAKGSTKVAVTGALGVIVMTLTLIMVPRQSDKIVLLIAVCVIMMIFSYITSSTMYTPVTEAKIPFKYVGTVLGIASAMGYSADIWLYRVCGNWLDTLGNAGYTNIWLLQAFGGLMMIACALLLARVYRKAKGSSEQREEEAA